MVPWPTGATGKLSTVTPGSRRRVRHRRIIDRMTGDSGAGLGRFLTIADTAEVLNISVGQAYALVRSGELPAIKIGAHGQWRIERDVLEGYIDAKYEESRRVNLWNQAAFADLPELFVEPPRPQP